MRDVKHHIRYIWIGPGGVFKSYVHHQTMEAAVRDLLDDGYTRTSNGRFTHPETPTTYLRLEDLGAITR